jgi:hypothetical protein
MEAAGNTSLIYTLRKTGHDHTDKVGEALTSRPVCGSLGARYCRDVLGSRYVGNQE